MSLFEKRSAIFSEDRRFRALLRIVWNASLPRIVFVGLNPSTADEFADDNTIRRCKDYARSWGYGELVMLNLFALRATDPREMCADADPVGPWHDVGSMAAFEKASVVVVCWGTGGSHQDRGAQVARQLSRFFAGDRLLCFGLNVDGSPKHPLYLPKDTALIRFEVARVAV